MEEKRSVAYYVTANDFVGVTDSQDKLQELINTLHAYCGICFSSCK